MRQRSNFWLAWFFLLTLIVISLSSCITQEKCNERFPPQVTTITKDSIVLVPDTVWLPATELSFDTAGVIPENVEFHHSVHNAHSGLTATVDIHNGTLHVDCKSDSLQRIINEQRHYISTHETKTSPPLIIKEPTFFDKLCRWIAGLSLFALLVLFIAKRRKV